MNARILNRDFKHPADGWYMIEALGDHPNRADGVVQRLKNGEPLFDALQGSGLFNDEFMEMIHTSEASGRTLAKSALAVGRTALMVGLAAWCIGPGAALVIAGALGACGVVGGVISRFRNPS